MQEKELLQKFLVGVNFSRVKLLFGKNIGHY